MSAMWDQRQFNSADYEVGAVLHLALQDGWSGQKIEDVKLTRKTPTGQMILEGASGRTYRADRRGSFLGHDRGLGRFVSAERADEIKAEKLVRDRWKRLEVLARDLEGAARGRDAVTAEKVGRKIAALMILVSA